MLQAADSSADAVRMVGSHSRAMPWSSLIRAAGAKRHLREQPAEHADRVALDGGSEPSPRTMMGLQVSPVHGHHCICNRCAMFAERIRDAA
jgi:hypothetical protein